MDPAQEHLQREARACYKRKDYKKALEYFSRAIGRAPSVQLLDNRAACHEKLSDFPAALKDAKKAIQQQGEDPTGYLRAGKILTRMKNDSVALEIYSLGLRSVKHIGQGYELLRKAHIELMTSLSPPKSVDPLTVLPRELAEQVLEYLSFKQRMNACLVSKQWTIFIRSASALWQHLDLTGAKRKVRSTFISRAINTGRKKLTAATLNKLDDFDKALAALLRHCPLQELTLLDTGLQSQSLVGLLERAKDLRALRVTAGTQIGGDTFNRLLQRCLSRLETLECSSLPRHVDLRLVQSPCDKLTTLILTTVGTDPTGVSLFVGLSVLAPNLRTLIIRDYKYATAGISCLSDLTQLQELELHLPVIPVKYLRLPHSLLKLRLTSTKTLNTSFFTIPDEPDKVRYRLPFLQELSVDLPSTPVSDLLQLLAADGTFNDAEKPEDIGTSLSGLRSLAVNSPLMPLDGLHLLLSNPRLKALQHFRLCGCTDLEVCAIVVKLKELRTVDLSESRVTGVAVKEDLMQLKHLERLILNDCRDLGRDAVEWARSQGMTVESKNSTELHGGRKVRY